MNIMFRYNQICLSIKNNKFISLLKCSNIRELNSQDNEFEPFLSCIWPFLIRQLFYEATPQKGVQFFVSCHSHVELTRQGIIRLCFIYIPKYWMYGYKKEF